MNEYFWFWWVFYAVLAAIALFTVENRDIAMLFAWGWSGLIVFMGMVKKL